MIRGYTPEDAEAVTRIFAHSGLPNNCLPRLQDSQFIVRLCATDGPAVRALVGVRLQGEGYALVDNNYGTPEERWKILQRLIAAGLAEASMKGLSQVTCWLPLSLENSFGKRLESMGFVRSPWQSWTVNI